MRAVQTFRLVMAMAAATQAAMPVMAQQAEATIYRDSNFRGPAVFVDRANPNLGLRFQVQSIRVASGSWELCPQPNFRGNCLTVGQSTSNLQRAYGWRGQLQSMRPVRGDGPPPMGPPPGGGNGVLQGMASEFHRAPQAGRGRVLACERGAATPDCAMESANRFCRSIGWTRSRHALMETVGNRIYLADVLCTRAA